MNEYVLHEQLLALEAIANQYPAGADCAHRIRQTIERIKTRLYRVAVIGEFKRGKSSLINAIIGAEVLPTDILPMTAAVTRVTYGEKRRILIRYKDGSSEERTVEELIDFATKYDAAKEKIAASIREIEVTYPSVFCKNHIDILDTPGLNDNESMTDVTLGVLGEVDAAIMVISAKAPLSLTEQNLILNMISQPQIRHIIFVVTHIDAISSRRSQQDKLLDFIRQRLSGELLEKARKMFEEKPRFAQKAQQILEKPDMFGVSSVLAMDGFIHDDEELLEQSRFPHFKKELLALLTAAQSEDVTVRTLEAAHEAEDNLKSWYAAARNVLIAEHMLWQSRRDQCRDYYANAQAKLNVMLQRMDAELAQKGLYKDQLLLPEWEKTLRKPFIRGLSELRTDTNTEENIRSVILAGGSEARATADELEEELESIIQKLRKNVLASFTAMRNACDFPNEGLNEVLSEWSKQPFPCFRWSDSLIPPVTALRGCNVMGHINYVISQSMCAYAASISKYLASWRLILIRQLNRDLEDQAAVEDAQNQIDRLKVQQDLLEQRYEKHKQSIGNILRILAEES